MAPGVIDQSCRNHGGTGPAGARNWSTWSDRLAALDRVLDPAGAGGDRFSPCLAGSRAFSPRGLAAVDATGERIDLLERPPLLRSRGGVPDCVALAGYLNRSRLIPCTADQVVITSSSQEAVGLMAKVWLDEGDQIAFESLATTALAAPFCLPAPNLRRFRSIMTG